ncbi:hypothetical protein P3T76_010794 [Phytophthora citrophthora]|uniref:Uncharacterized protein n=1 Tax=Phytophthora citrophthora TaxID=4793 RepID=A0AAD9GAS5_9STRA|nr:hypothetical protein P3T76_010794 [Phytophthora citrophthora]
MRRAVVKAKMKSTRKQDVFGHSFLLTCWNLMCRAKSTESIRYGHLSWREDSMTMSFAHMKNDQDGSRPRDPRHVYANRTMPEVCPVLGIAVYFAIMGFTQDGKLFPGGNQYSRFLKVLKSVLCGDLMRDVLTEAGMTHGAFGTHSTRKGAATYVSSCSTSGPFTASICLRAGWKLPGVQDKYVYFEAADDMVLDFLLTLLTLRFYRRFFNTQSGQTQDALELRQRIQVALDAVFPGLPVWIGIFDVSQNLFAAKSTFDPFIFDTPLFKMNNEPQLQWQKQRVECRKCQMVDYITATGIPPHFILMFRLSCYRAELACMRGTFAESFESALKRHINGSVMTVEALEAAFT